MAMIPRTTVDVKNGELEAIKRVFNSAVFVKGIECQQFEKEFCHYQGVKYGAGVNSGTSALLLALLALDVKQGDEVITVPNTFAATVNAIIFAGARPTFVDIDPSTFNLDVSNLRNLITPKTKVILPVHLYGLMADMSPIVEIAEEKDIYVLEDACQAHGAEYFNKKAGTLGDVAAFSFFPTKNTTVAGDAGMVISNNEEIIEKVFMIRDHGRKNRKHLMAGLNNRLSEILAAIGREHLKNLDTFNEHRRKIAKLYGKCLQDCPSLTLPTEPNNYKHVYHLFTIKSDKREQLQQFLKTNSISSKVMYPERLNELDYVVNVAGKQKTPISEKINRKILSLPISGTMSFENIERVCIKVKDFFEKS